MAKKNLARKPASCAAINSEYSEKSEQLLFVEQMEERESFDAIFGKLNFSQACVNFCIFDFSSWGNL